jgi:hypothetical protein
MSHVRVRRPLAATLWLAAWLAPPLAPVRAAAQPGPQPVMPSLPRRDGKHDFEFAVGSWKVAEWRRRERTRPDSVSTSDILDAVAVWRPLADGGGMLEEYEVAQPDGRHVRHAALLTYDLYSQQWVVHRSEGLPFDADDSVRGGFVCREQARSCEGEFTGVRSPGGRPLLVRETIRVSQPNAWEWIRQLSSDGGASWEIVRHRRYARAAAADSARRVRATEPRPERTTYCCAQMEIRRYVVRGSEAPVLRRLFDEENRLGHRVAAQHRAWSGSAPDGAAVGIRWMENIALLRDVDQPDSYVWLRGFADEPNAVPFYFSSMWGVHEDAVRRAGIRSTQAHLVETWLYGGAFVVGAPTPSDAVGQGLVVANVYTVPTARLLELQYAFSRTVVPVLHRTGGQPVAYFRSSRRWQFQQELSRAFGDASSPDTGIFVWFARFPGADAYRRHVDALQQDTAWTRTIRPRLDAMVPRPPEVWRLEPVAGSRAIF